MTCAHCCFSCTAKGHDMSQDIFDLCLKTAKDYGASICIGGGEPTLHPKFKQFLFQAMTETIDNDSEEVVDLTTNGSNRELALMLAKMAKKGWITCRLSNDQYHDPIDPLVVKAFTRDNQMISRGEHDGRGINNNKNSHIAVGRGKKLSGGDKTGCPCESLFVSPIGIVSPCGCRKSKLGKLGEINLPSYLRDGLCEKSEDFRDFKKEWEKSQA